MKGPRRIIVAVQASGLYGRNVARGVLQYATEHARWECHYEAASNHPDVCDSIRHAITSWRAHGIVGQILEDPLPRIIRRSGICAVNVSSHVGTLLPTVHVDDQAVGRLAARYYLERGLRHLAFLGRPECRYAEDRAEGFRLEAENAGYAPRIFTPDARGVGSWLKGFEQMLSWLRRLMRPLGILACDDAAGYDLLRACRQLKLRVPEEIAVLGVGNDVATCSLGSPQLSSIVVPSQRIGYEAARMLDLLLRGRRIPTQVLRLPVADITHRQSSDILAMRDRSVAAALRFIQQHAAEPITVDEVVIAATTSRRALERRFLKDLGRTPKEEILRAHLERAKTLLTQTRQKVDVVAKDSGFGKYSNFTRSFRLAFGMLPSAFRRKYQTTEPAESSDST